MIDGLLLILVMIGLSAAAILAARSPKFWKRVGQDALTAMLSKILQPFRPKTLTKEELERVAKGRDPIVNRK